MQQIPAMASAGGNYTGVVTATKQITQIDEQLARQSELIDRTQKAIDAITHRLIPVLRDLPPAPSQPMVPDVVLVPLAEGIRNRNKGLESILSALEQLHSQIEL